MLFGLRSSYLERFKEKTSFENILHLNCEQMFDCCCLAVSVTDKISGPDDPVRPCADLQTIFEIMPSYYSQECTEKKILDN